MEGKKPWLSKTLWVNLLMAVFAMVWPPASEFIAANPETVAVVFAGINAVLRLVTKDKIVLIDDHK